MKVVIFGRDAAAWLSANALQTALGGTGVTITVVELPSLLQPQDIYPTLPALEAFHRQMCIDEHDLLRATRGAFTLGQSFHGFGPAAFFHAYGSHGVAINRLPFFPYYIKARQRGLNVALEDFSLTAAAAKQGRFVVPDATTESFARTDYGYHLPAQAYVAYVRAQALRHGVTITSTRSATVERDDTGIAALVLPTGERITGELFIDATGSEGQLMQALGITQDSWRQWFPNDRVLSADTAPFASLPLYARIMGQDTGWLGLYPAQDRTRLVQVHDSRRMSDDAALQAAARVTGLKLGNAVVSPLAPGRARQAWAGNCVAIGEAACVFDPIDSPGLQAIQTGLVHLLALFPAGEDAAARDEYNRLMQQSFERIRDFQIAHAAALQPDMAAPETVAHKLACFRARGVVPQLEEETFPLDSWEAILTGHGLTPRSYAPLADATPDNELMTHLKTMLGYIRDQVQAMNSHDAYLELFCK